MYYFLLNSEENEVEIYKNRLKKKKKREMCCLLFLTHCWINFDAGVEGIGRRFH
jgi:hypothetical protein